MEWIRVEPTGDITLRESGLTSIWSFITREFGQPLEERRQMTAVVTRTGALSGQTVVWHTIDWYAVHRTVRRLQARMVKVVSQPDVRCGTTAFRKERSQGLSGMQGNCAPRDAVLNPRRSREKFEGRLLGHLTYLKAKARGDKSMSEKQGASEGVYGVVLQDPRDMVKATLPESCATSPIAGYSSQRREVRKNRPLGHPTYRMAKALRDHSLLGTREMS